MKVMWGKVWEKVWGRVSDPSNPSAARQRFLRWMKFNLVGLLGIAVQVTALAILLTHFHLGTMPATALAVELTVIHNFLWHERVVWRDRPSQRFVDILIRLIKFNVTNDGVSIAGNLLLMRFLVDGLGMNFAAANLIAIAACALINFALSDCFVFRPERSAG